MKKVNLFFLIIVMGLFSCRRDALITEAPSESSGSELDIKQIKTFVEQSENPSETLSQKLAVKGNTKDDREKTLDNMPVFDMDWKNAFIHNNNVKGYPVIMVPLKNNNVNRSTYPDMNPKGYRLVAFQHNEEKEIKWQIFEVHPDADYIKIQMRLRGVSEIGNEYADYAKVLNKKYFSGYVFIYHASGQFLRGYHMTDGVYDKKFEPKLN